MNDSANITAEDYCADFCPRYAQNQWMFYTILYFGTCCSLISVTENLVVFFSLIRHKQCFKTYLLFLLFLALVDVIVSATYIPLIVIDQAKDRFNLTWLKHLWTSYFAQMLTVTNICLTANSFILVAIQLERYLLTTTRFRKIIETKLRVLLTVCAVIIALALRAPMLYELTVRL